MRFLTAYHVSCLVLFSLLTLGIARGFVDLAPVFGFVSFVIAATHGVLLLGRKCEESKVERCGSHFASFHCDKRAGHDGAHVWVRDVE